MAQFLAVPPELLPIIFDFVLRPQHLSSLCLVNRTFNRFATPFLYRRLFIFAWYTDVKSRLFLLFRTLAESTHLARHVQRLAIQSFPKALSSAGFSDLLDLCARGIRNCVNLRSCAWTRDGSLHSTVLESLRDCPQLQELEINGNSSEYDPAILTQFDRLNKISLIMPSAQVLGVLPSWISMTGVTLKSLNIICKASTLVTDGFLERLSPHLASLQHLSIVGCPKVTQVGIAVVASANQNGLVGINLEGLSQAFSMSAFKNSIMHTQAFRQLRSVTLTAHIQVPLSDWSRDVDELLSSSPLESFSVYSTTTSTGGRIPDDFWRSLVHTHGRRLKCFSIHRMPIGVPALELICSQCPLLEQLFVVVGQRELDVAARAFALARNLRTLHIKLPLAMSESMIAPSVLMQNILSIVSLCSPTIAFIGCNTRVWQIQRTVQEDENGEKYTVPTLAAQENPDIPEQFLVIRA
ncbi:hypothetical protein F5I97DRAFT_1901313 [Phlebopus sp. FC_14]|nr:hypothetical protein F5I97DRAFT_1901313 [Phlebopus sp. FC_14]